MLPRRMKDLDDVAYYARYIKVVREPGGRLPTVYAARPSMFSYLLTRLALGPNERLVRGRDDLKPNIALISKEILTVLQ